MKKCEYHYIAMLLLIGSAMVLPSKVFAGVYTKKATCRAGAYGITVHGEYWLTYVNRSVVWVDVEKWTVKYTATGRGAKVQSRTKATLKNLSWPGWSKSHTAIYNRKQNLKLHKDVGIRRGAYQRHAVTPKVWQGRGTKRADCVGYTRVPSYE